MAILSSFRSQVIVLTGHESSGFMNIAEKLVERIKRSHPNSKVLFLEGFWSTVGRPSIDFRTTLKQDDPLDRLWLEYKEWKRVIEELKPHYDLIVVCGTWIKHLASHMALHTHMNYLDLFQPSISDYPIYFVSQNLNQASSAIQKKSHESFFELSMTGKSWTFVPSSQPHHLDGLYQQVVKNYLSSVC